MSQITWSASQGLASSKCSTIVTHNSYHQEGLHSAWYIIGLKLIKLTLVVWYWWWEMGAKACVNNFFLFGKFGQRDY